MEGPNLVQVPSVLKISRARRRWNCGRHPIAQSSSLAKTTIIGKCTLGTSVALTVWFNGRRAPSPKTNWPVGADCVKVGVLKEIATGERRVALTPDAVTKLVKAGFEVLVESGAGREALI